MTPSILTILVDHARGRLCRDYVNKTGGCDSGGGEPPLPVLNVVNPHCALSCDRRVRATGGRQPRRALRGGRPPDRSVLELVCAFGEHGRSSLEDDLVQIVSGDSVACWSNDRIAGGAGMINFSTGKVWKVGVTMVIMQAIEKDEADAWAGGLNFKGGPSDVQPRGVWSFSLGICKNSASEL